MDHHGHRGGGADEQAAEDLLRILDETQGDHRSWRLGMRCGQAEAQPGYNELARGSHLTPQPKVTAVSGLLQTPAYARQMFVEMVKLHGLEVEYVDAPMPGMVQADGCPSVLWISLPVEVRRLF